MNKHWPENAQLHTKHYTVINDLYKNIEIIFIFSTYWLEY